MVRSKFSLLLKMKSVSYSGILAAPVQVGQVFVVSGRAARDATRIDLNLSSDKLSSEIPFHLSCRFKENEIVRNHKANGVYGQEEKSPGRTNQKNPFRAGDDFIISILVDHDRFHLSLNNRKYTNFLYRMPLANITVIQVVRDVEYIRRIDHVTVNPLIYPVLQQRDTGFSCSSDIPVPYKQGHIVVLHGVTSGNSNRSFAVHFLDGIGPKTALHFDCDFQSLCVIARNHLNKKNEKVKMDQELHPYPLIHERPFKIAFGFSDQGFRIAINGRHFCNYKYFGPMETYSGIKCSEDDGMILNVMGVDHFITQDKSVRSIEDFSRI